MKRVYVAASSHELERVVNVQDELRAAGFVITHNWAGVILANGGCDSNTPDDVAEQIARTDLEGVATANVVVFLAPNDTSKMGWLEVGYAMASGIPVVCAHDIEAKRKQSIALRLCVPCTDDDIVATVERLTTKRSDLVAAMSFVRFLAGQTVDHALKLERATTPYDVQSKTEQIANDLKLIASEAGACMHALVWTCIRRDAA